MLPSKHSFWNGTSRQGPTAAAACLQFAAAFQHIPVAHTLFQGDPGEIERIRQNELATATAAARQSDGDGNALSVARAAPGAPSVRDRNFQAALNDAYV